MEAGDQEVSSMKLQTLQLLPEEQIVTLRQQMVESQASYQRKLQSSQEAQHRQAVLVQKLQAKVKQKYIHEHPNREAVIRSERHWWEAKEEHSLERALVQLEEEQQRCENLAEVNTLLREHLSKANEVNTALREDVQKLTVDWTRARDELELKESEWRTEREVGLWWGAASKMQDRGERNSEILSSSNQDHLWKFLQFWVWIDVG
uniref:Rootletin-like coiled-coil domain-containing protein n=1 Tax=Chrysemys picta bellii TaxID=8478 RepID=A0A8C3F971_CHRPI